MVTPCELLAPRLGELFTCSAVNDYVRIRTPYLYPDGDVVDLFYKQGLQGDSLTDLGETLGWLRTQTASQRRSAKHRRLIADVCSNHGVELFQGSLMVRVPRADDLASAVTRLSQAALRVADLSFLFRTQAFASVVDEIEEFLREQTVPFTRGEKLVGRSQWVWTLDFHTRTPKRSSLISVLSTGTRGATHGLAERAVATWYDLSYLTVGPEALQFVSLFDDTVDVWSAEDLELVRGLSEVVLWSRPDTLADVLAAAG